MSPAWGNSWRLSSCAFLPASVRTRDQRHQNREQTVPAPPTSADELASGTRQRAFAFIGQAGLLWRRGTALRVENHWFLGTWAFQHRTQLGLGRRCFVLCALCAIAPLSWGRGNQCAAFERRLCAVATRLRINPAASTLFRPSALASLYSPVNRSVAATARLLAPRPCYSYSC